MFKHNHKSMKSIEKRICISVRWLANQTEKKKHRKQNYEQQEEVAY